MGDPERAASIVVHGLYGTLAMPDGVTYSSAMAPLGASLDDEKVAAVLTYARRSWGNFASPVSTADVARARAATPPRGGMWEGPALAETYPLEKEGLVFRLPPPPPAIEVHHVSLAVAILVAVGSGLLIIAGIFVYSRMVDGR